MSYLDICKLRPHRSIPILWWKIHLFAEQKRSQSGAQSIPPWSLLRLHRCQCMCPQGWLVWWLPVGGWEILWWRPKWSQPWHSLHSLGCTISKGDSLISIKYPVWFGAGSNGEGLERNTNNSQIGIFLRNSYRTKDFFYIINSKIIPVPGTDEDVAELGNNSRGLFGDLVEAEASLCAHGAICCHSNFGRGTSRGDHKVVTHKLDWVTFLSGYLRGDLYVISIVHLLLDVLVHLVGNFRFRVNLVVKRLNYPGSTEEIFS